MSQDRHDSDPQPVPAEDYVPPRVEDLPAENGPAVTAAGDSPPPPK